FVRSIFYLENSLGDGLASTMQLQFISRYI
ncbi:MAG: hypothetical protein ACI9AT_000904, partial [Ulvibacter sp.]